MSPARELPDARDPSATAASRVLASVEDATSFLNDDELSLFEGESSSIYSQHITQLLQAIRNRRTSFKIVHLLLFSARTKDALDDYSCRGSCKFKLLSFASNFLILLID